MKPKYTDAARYEHGYITAKDTDVRKTFARIRRQLADQEREREAIAAEQRVKLRQIKGAK